MLGCGKHLSHPFTMINFDGGGNSWPEPSDAPTPSLHSLRLRKSLPADESEARAVSLQTPIFAFIAEGRGNDAAAAGPGHFTCSGAAVASGLQWPESTV